MTLPVLGWIAGLAGDALATARLLDRWNQVEEAGQIHPTALAAVRAFRAG